MLGGANLVFYVAFLRGAFTWRFYVAFLRGVFTWRFYVAVCTGVLKPVLKGAEAGAEARGDFFEVRLTKRGGHGSLDLDEI